MVHWLINEKINYWKQKIKLLFCCLNMKYRFTRHVDQAFLVDIQVIDIEYHHISWNLFVYSVRLYLNNHLHRHILDIAKKMQDHDVFERQRRCNLRKLNLKNTNNWKQKSMNRIYYHENFVQISRLMMSLFSFLRVQHRQFHRFLKTTIIHLYTEKLENPTFSLKKTIKRIFRHSLHFLIFNRFNCINQFKWFHFFLLNTRNIRERCWTRR